jgi:2'-5' RNA ligase
MPRLFTALEIPAATGQSLSMLRGGLPGARWIDPEHYHLTLRFIGDIDDVMAHEIAFMLSNVRRLSFELRLDGLTSFGGRRPRAVVATVAPTQQLYELQAEHERLMRRVGLEPEGRKYTPHVTMSPTISRRITRFARRRFASRASCCTPRAPRSAAAPMWSRRPIRWRRERGRIASSR